MADNTQPKYKRVLLKLSGEALAKDVDGIYNHGFIDEIAQVVKNAWTAALRSALSWARAIFGAADRA